MLDVGGGQFELQLGAQCAHPVRQQGGGAARQGPAQACGHWHSARIRSCRAPLLTCMCVDPAPPCPPLCSCVQPCTALNKATPPKIQYRLSKDPAWCLPSCPTTHPTLVPEQVTDYATSCITWVPPSRTSSASEHPGCCGDVPCPASPSPSFATAQLIRRAECLPSLQLPYWLCLPRAPEGMLREVFRVQVCRLRQVLGLQARHRNHTRHPGQSFLLCPAGTRWVLCIM